MYLGERCPAISYHRCSIALRASPLFSEDSTLREQVYENVTGSMDVLSCLPSRQHPFACTIKYTYGGQPILVGDGGRLAAAVGGRFELKYDGGH